MCAVSEVSDVMCYDTPSPRPIGSGQKKWVRAVGVASAFFRTWEQLTNRKPRKKWVRSVGVTPASFVMGSHSHTLMVLVEISSEPAKQMIELLT